MTAGARRTVRSRLASVFPGWWIAIAASAMMALVTGLLTQSYGAYVVVLRADLGWSATLLSAGYALLRLEGGALGPLQGWLIDRFGPRVNMRAGVLMLGVGFMLFSGIQTPVQFFGAFVVMALGASFAGIMPVSVTIMSWFRRRRSRAMSVALVGVSAGGMAVPLVALSLERWDWRPTAFVSGVIVLAAGMTLTRMFHHRPEDIGLVVDGAAVAGDGAGRSPGDDAVGAHGGLTAREALRTSAFWAISLGHAAALAIVGTVLVHLVPNLTVSLGFSLSTASLAVLALTVLHFAGLGLGGLVGDRFDKRLLAAGCLASHAAGVFVLASARSWGLVLLGCALHGVAWGLRGPLVHALRADYFGRQSFGKILGLSSVLTMLGSTAGPLVAGVLFDHFGDYVVAFRVMAGIGLLGAVLFALARPPRQPQRIRVQDSPEMRGARRGD